MRISRAVLAGALFVTGLGACEAADQEEANLPAATGTTPSAGSSDENRVEIVMTEYAYEMPAPVRGGNVTLEFTNNGELPHEAAFAFVGEGRDEQDVMSQLGGGEPPSWLEDLAGIPVLDPGATTSMTRQLEPGTYAFFCYLPVPETGAPHVTEGMVEVFEVEGTSDAKGPKPVQAITVTESGFLVPGLEAGRQAIELVNDGEEPHEFAIFSLEPGKTSTDVEKWFRSGFESDKPAVFAGGLQSIEPGTSVVVEITFEAGRTYVVEDFENKLQTTFKVE